MAAPPLSQGAISAIFQQKDLKFPVLQLLSISQVPGQQERYKYVNRAL